MGRLGTTGSFGFPDFSKLTDASGNIIEAIVEINVSDNGNTNADFKAANDELAKKLGLTKAPSGGYHGTIDGLEYTWHHYQDGKYMMLVPKGLNDGIRHAGGASFARKDLKGVLPSPFEITSKFLNCK